MVSKYAFAFSAGRTAFFSPEQYRMPMFLTSGVSLPASVKISSTGTMFEVPVAFLSGFAMSPMMPAATGSVTEMKTTGAVTPALTTACVAGVTIGTTRS